MMNPPPDTIFYDCVHCHDQVYMRGGLLVARKRRDGMIIDSDCPGQPVPGHASPRWRGHAVSAAADVSIADVSI